MARMELISGIERRRRWSDDAKLRILAEAEQPGACIGDVAGRHDIYPAQIRLWHKMFTTFDLPGALVPVDIVDDAGVGGGVERRGPGDALWIAPTIEITLRNGRCLKVSADIEPGMLTSLIVCVEAA
jgi:transposase